MRTVRMTLTRLFHRAGSTHRRRAATLKPPGRAALLAVALMTAACHTAFPAPLPTTWVYQGSLTDEGQPAQGRHTFRITLHTSAQEGAPVGPSLTQTVCVKDGVFTLTLEFGSLVPFGDSLYYLDLAVAKCGACDDATPADLNLELIPLKPRTPLYPAPYALFARQSREASRALAVAPGGVSAAAVQSNAISSLQIADGSITIDDLDLRGLGTVFWKLTGNAGTIADTHFLGTTDPQPLELRVNNQRALQLTPNADDDTTSGTVNVLGGSPANAISPGARGATIAGGGAATHNGIPAANAAQADFAAVGGGLANRTLSLASTISGGHSNFIDTLSTSAVIGGGRDNTLGQNSPSASIHGGSANVIDAESPATTISGGSQNSVGTASPHSTIAGGLLNGVGTDSPLAAIGGGQNNLISTFAPAGTIAGGDGNVIDGYTEHSTIGGGGNNFVGFRSRYGTISGGLQNQISPQAYQATIGGGYANRIDGRGRDSTIGGGSDNLISEQTTAATIAGGSLNHISIASWHSAIGGGFSNLINAYSPAAAINGGSRNAIQPYSFGVTIAGGMDNFVGTAADCSSIGGGQNNAMRTSTKFSTIAGGSCNTNAGYYATIPGGHENLAEGDFAFAAGHHAKALHDGAFVWADASDSDVSSSSTNEFTARASGGVRFFSSTDLLAGVKLDPNGNAWTSICDRNLKRDIQPIADSEILDKLADVPITRWRYQWEDPGSTPHIGPMAQEFKAAFYPGRNDTAISTLEFDGVALAAIQGLNRKLEKQLERKDSELRALRDELRELKALILQKSSGAPNAR